MTRKPPHISILGSTTVSCGAVVARSRGPLVELLQTRWLALAAILIAHSLFAEQGRAQTIDSIRNSVFTPGPSSTKKREKRQRSSQNKSDPLKGFSWTLESDEDDGDDDDTLTGMGIQMISSTASFVFLGNPNNSGYDVNYELSEPVQYDPEQPPLESPSMYFAHYPYADGHDGYTVLSTDWKRQGSRHVRPLTGGIQLTAAHGNDFDDLQWYTTKGLFEWSNSRLGIDGEWTYFHENLGPNNSDEFHLGDVNLLWRRLQTERLLLRWGVGMAWYHDAVGTEAGINGTVKADYFIGSPWVISGEYDLGKVGSATIQHVQLGIGATWNHVELFSAFDYRRFGDVDVAGPMFGIRLWW